MVIYRSMGMQEDREENEGNREPRDDDATASTKNCDKGTVRALGVHNEERGREDLVQYNYTLLYTTILYCYIFFECKNFRREYEYMEYSTCIHTEKLISSHSNNFFREKDT